MTDNLAPLNFKPDWRHLDEKGDYSFTEMFGFQVLVMRCPFCDNEAPFPPMFGKIVRKNPLTLSLEMSCGYCGISFMIRAGVAFGTTSNR